MDAKPVQPWLRADIEAMLALLPVFESPDFVPCTWTKPAPGEDLFLPYPTYSRSVDELHHLAFASTAYVDPYAPLPEDAQLPFPSDSPATLPEFIQAASLNQLRRYLTHLFRAERFCDGVVEGEFKNCNLVAVLRRMRDLTTSGRVNSPEQDPPHPAS
jgi:hypothetical protein